MHSPEGIERTKSVAVDTVLRDQVKYSILILKQSPSFLISQFLISTNLVKKAFAADLHLPILDEAMRDRLRSFI